MKTRARRSRRRHEKESGRNCKVTESTESGRSDRKSPRLYGLLMARGGRFLVVAASAVLMLGGAIGGYILGLDLAHHDLAAARELIQQLQPESQRLKKQIIDQNASLGALQAKLASVQAALNAIRPSENTYKINANQSMIVAGGHLTIGLIGSPANESVNININGTQHSAVTGDIFNVAPDPATTCQVTVQSFDMFKVILIASCAAVKPQ